MAVKRDAEKVKSVIRETLSKAWPEVQIVSVELDEETFDFNDEYFFYDLVLADIDALSASKASGVLMLLWPPLKAAGEDRHPVTRFQDEAEFHAAA